MNENVEWKYFSPFHLKFQTVDYGSVIVIQNDATPRTVMCAIYNEFKKFSIERFSHHRSH